MVFPCTDKLQENSLIFFLRWKERVWNGNDLPARPHQRGFLTVTCTRARHVSRFTNTSGQGYGLVHVRGPGWGVLAREKAGMLWKQRLRLASVPLRLLGIKGDYWGHRALPWLTRCWGPCPTSSHLLSKRKSLIRTTECRVLRRPHKAKHSLSFKKRGEGDLVLIFIVRGPFLGRCRVWESRREQGSRLTHTFHQASDPTAPCGFFPRAPAQPAQSNALLPALLLHLHSLLQWKVSPSKHPLEAAHISALPLSPSTAHLNTHLSHLSPRHSHLPMPNALPSPQAFNVCCQGVCKRPQGYPPQARLQTLPESSSPLLPRAGKTPCVVFNHLPNLHPTCLYYETQTP